MKYLKITHIFIYVLTVTFFQCTQVKNVKSIIDLATSVIEIINAFSESNVSFTNKVKETTELTSKTLNSGGDVKEVAIFWEKYWEEITTDYGNLNNQLSVIKDESLKYFAILDENNALIVDASLRQQDSLKTAQLRQRWDFEYQKASNRIAEIGVMITKGNDYNIILRNTAGRAEIIQSISALNDISYRADLLATDIRVFAINAKAIFQPQI
ncbi:hypothetical protein [Emticicia oligotrophica]|uniref:hypothetical protein n=1 Tax=Emticicia oligotrophica TaxID=312279 RepID=UPI00273A9FB7|nr:hypothetical protein [Emticicia oligotrophica]